MTDLDQTRMHHRDLDERLWNNIHTPEIGRDDQLTYCWTEYIYGFAKGPDDPMPIIF